MQWFFRHWAQALSNADRRRVARFCGAAVLLSLVEAASVFSIMPVVALIVGSSGHEVRHWLPFDVAWMTEQQLIMALGFGFGGLLLAANVITVWVTWYGTQTRNVIQRSMVARILRQIHERRYEYLLKTNASELSMLVNRDVDDAVFGCLMPVLQGVSRAISAAMITAVLVAHDAGASLVAGIVAVSLYVLIYKVLRRRIDEAAARQQIDGLRARRMIVECLQGLRELRLLGRESTYLENIDASSKRAGNARATVVLLAAMPKHVNEVFVSFALVLILVVSHRMGERSVDLLPFLAGFAFAGYRLLPALQQIYSGFVALTASKPLLDRIARATADDPRRSVKMDQAPSNASQHADDLLRFENVAFHFENQTTPVVQALTLAIPRGAAFGFVGRSGVGKTTVVNLMVGLLEPTSGVIVVEGRRLDETTVKAWQRKLGYVPQDVFLSDDTIAANIAFGVPPHQVDLAAVRRAATVSQLSQDIDAMPAGYETTIGERGNQLSGGQRLRLGLARALYHEPELLILDEATGALDAATERQVLDALREALPSMTIVAISHRPSTLVGFDQIVQFNGPGDVVVRGATTEKASA